MFGRITFWNQAKGFGFISVPTSEQFFFHYSNFEGIPKLADRVTFDLGDPVEVGKRTQAVNVRINVARDISAGIGVLASGLKGGE
jgi:cold shock CspA family protein